MCGIAGLVGGEVNNHRIEAALTSLQNRGPDARGMWRNKFSDVTLLHTRLSIIDISPAGAQPFVSDCGRYALVFNGEVYNHTELRRRVPNQSWKGSSDTETLMALLQRLSIDECLDLVEGMFAFAFWDDWEKELVLARDRVGEKPLVYTSRGSQFVFASTVASLRSLAGSDLEISVTSLNEYLTYGFISAPDTIYQGVFKLPPGHYLKLKEGRLGVPVRYWRYEPGADNVFCRDPQRAVVELENLLVQSVKQRAYADVPVGAFLSGGNDSSLIASIMQQEVSNQLRTFTIGFSDKRYDEASQARAIAEYLGSTHTEIYLSSKEAMEYVPKLGAAFDEPFSDASQLPTLIVSNLARGDVKVCLSGDGGDELFGGYNRYLRGFQLWNMLRLIPKGFRKSITRDNYIKILNKFNRYGIFQHKQSHIFKLINVMQADELYSYYKNVLDLKNNNILKDEFKYNLELDLTRNQYLDPLTQLMIWDFSNYLPNDVLVKVDRASMFESLEVRSPFLDRRLIDFSGKIPSSLKCRHGIGKRLLKEILDKRLPSKLLDQRKRGFEPPIGSWLRGGLRDWAASLIIPQSHFIYAYVDYDKTQKLWQDFLSGQPGLQDKVWNFLMLQSWCVNSFMRNE